jgi:hypothetical protein
LIERVVVQMVKSEFIIVRVGNECGSNIFVAVNNDERFHSAEKFYEVEIFFGYVLSFRSIIIIEMFVDV